MLRLPKPPSVIKKKKWSALKRQKEGKENKDLWFVSCYFMKVNERSEYPASLLLWLHLFESVVDVLLYWLGSLRRRRGKKQHAVAASRAHRDR